MFPWCFLIAANLTEALFTVQDDQTVLIEATKKGWHRRFREGWHGPEESISGTTANPKRYKQTIKRTPLLIDKERIGVGISKKQISRQGMVCSINFEN